MGSLIICVFLALCILVFVLFIFVKNRATSETKSIAITQPIAVEAPVTQPIHEVVIEPRKIAIIDLASCPVITIEASDSIRQFEKAKPISLDSQLISRLSGVLQAAPAIITANSSSGKHLMEVVVNGSLVRASDGSGFRAIVMGAVGIEENARLFEVENLQNIINSAAVWQIASVLVAQKHLADISKKLDEIMTCVNGISQFLSEQRRARIQSTYEYLCQAYEALRAGELSPSVRIELESCERDLGEVFQHLQNEYQREISKRVEHKEIFGTETLTADISKKIEHLQELGRDIEFLVKTRIAAWHVLSLYPGEPKMKLARKKSIECSIASFEKLLPSFSQVLMNEVNSIKSFWNSGTTLDERKQGLKTKILSTQEATALVGKTANNSLYETAERLLLLDQPVRLWLAFENGHLTHAREEHSFH